MEPIRWSYVAAWTIFFIVLMAAFSKCSHAAICFADADGVRHHSPGAWPSWTYRMSGHEGEKCYFPTTKGRLEYPGAGRRAHKADDSVSAHRRTAGSIPATGAIPLPRPIPFDKIGGKHRIDNPADVAGLIDIIDEAYNLHRW